MEKQHFLYFPTPKNLFDDENLLKMLSQVPRPDACLSCGACCAHFRVSFYWAEGIHMPEHYTEPVTAVHSCMAGTNQKNPRCIALEGEIGKQVSCGLYELRSSSCKEVQIADAQCNKARLAHNMLPFVQIDADEADNDDSFEYVS